MKEIYICSSNTDRNEVLPVVEMLEARTDVILMMGQHQLTALGKYLMRQVEECLLVGGEGSHGN